MNIEDKKAHLERIIKKVQGYSGLYSSEDFKSWKKDIVDNRLKGYQKTVLAQNVDTEEGRKAAISNIIRYQELKFVTEDIFNIMQSTENQARKKLKELETS